MTDEEKKAIELLEDYLICGNIEGVLCRNLRIIFTIIEKQSKEIEELKEGFKIQEHNYQVAIEEIEQRWEDKIKAKIEELEKEQDDNRKVLYNAVNNLCFKEIDKICNRISVNMAIRDILQSLLRKEFPVTITKEELEKRWKV